MRLPPGVFLSIGVMLLAACTPNEIPEFLIPEEEARFARQHIDLYRAGDIETIVNQLSPDIGGDDLDEVIQKLIDLQPGSDPLDVSVVQATTTATPSGKVAHLVFQYEFPETWLAVDVIVESRAEGFVISRLYIEPLERSLQELNAFNVNGRGIAGYIVILCMAGNVVFILVTFIVCLRTPIPRRKWLWAVFTLVGAGIIRLNWSTGDLQYSIFSFQLLGAGFVRSGLAGPWILSFAFPLGAVAFWARRPAWLAQRRNEEAAN